MRWRFNPLEWHHLYFGLLLVGLYFWIGSKWPHPSNWYVLFVLAGWLIILDDLWQHLKQSDDPNYKSPLHRAFEVMWRKIFGSWWPFGRL